MDIFQKIDVALETMSNAAKKTTVAAPLTNEDLERANQWLDQAGLPPLPEDFMYLLRKGSAYKGPYFNIYGMDGMQAAQKPDDIALIDASLYLNRHEDDDDPKGLMLGYLDSARMMIVYKHGKYYSVEDDRGNYSFFESTESLGDFMIHEIRTADKKNKEKWSD